MLPRFSLFNMALITSLLCKILQCPNRKMGKGLVTDSSQEEKLQINRKRKKVQG